MYDMKNLSRLKQSEVHAPEAARALWSEQESRARRNRRLPKTCSPLRRCMRAARSLTAPMP